MEFRPGEKQRMPSAEAVLRAVVTLNVLHTNSRIYPAEHIQIKRSLQRAHEILCSLLASAAQITILATRNDLVYGEEYLDSRNPALREFASVLDQSGIACIVFERGLGKEDLSRFMGFLAARGSDKGSQGGQSLDFPRAAFSKIHVRYIDYSKLRLTEETEIVPPSSAEERTRKLSFWRSFMASLSSTGLSQLWLDSSSGDTTHFDPSHLASFLNEQPYEMSLTVRAFESAIRRHLATLDQKAQPSNDFIGGFQELRVFLKELNPQLRREFLMVFFRDAVSQTSSAQAEQVLQGLSEDLAAEMLAHAQREGLEFSPSLLRLTKKLTDADSRQEGDAARDAPAPLGEDPAGPMTLKEVESLTGREEYEKYVIPAYSDMLGKLTYAPPPPEKTAQEAFRIKDHMETLEDGYLNLQSARTLLMLLDDENITFEDYQAYSGQLISRVVRLIENGEFSFLLDVLKTFERHTSEGSLPDIRNAAGFCLGRFRGPLIISSAVAAFDKRVGEPKSEIQPFLLCLGPRVVPEVIACYGTRKNPQEAEAFLEILDHFVDQAIIEARRHLSDSRPEFLRRMVMLIGRWGNVEDLAELEPLLQHEDRAVWTDALAILLKFKVPLAVTALREKLASNEPESSIPAIRLAGSFQVKEVASDLVSMIRRPMLFRVHFERNEELIRALGAIGTPLAIPVLEKVARTLFTFYPRRLSCIKLTIFETLENYPFEDLGRVLKAGQKSRDEKVREICRKLIRSKAGRGERLAGLAER